MKHGRVWGVVLVAMVAVGACSSADDVVSSSTTSSARPPEPTASTSPPDTEPGYAGPDAEILVLTRGQAVVAIDPADGSVIEEVVAATDGDGPQAVGVTVAADGERYVSMAMAPQGQCDVRVFHVADGDLEEQFVGKAPAFSPDGRFVAYLDDGYARLGLDSGLPFCVHDLVVVRDLTTGDERTWRLVPDDDVDPANEFELEDFYMLGGTPGALDWAPDSRTLSMMIFGEGFTSYTIDATADELEPVQLTVGDDAAGALDEVLPNGYGVSTDEWTADGDLLVVAFSYHWDGWARGRAADGVVVEVSETDPGRLTRSVGEQRDGYELVIDRDDAETTLVLIAPDGSERELMADVASAQWS